MRVSIEFSSRIPDRVFFEQVSIPIIPYIQPPKRCFICQRYGHSSLSCRRKTACSNCAQDHFHTQCTVTDKELFKCASCDNNHRASSTICNYFKQALKIAAQFQESRISQIQAARAYAKLYSNEIPALNGPPTRMITPSLNLSPPQSSLSQSTSNQLSTNPGCRPKVKSNHSANHSGNTATQSSLSHQSTSLGSIPPAQRSNRKKTEEDAEEERRRRKSRRSKLTSKTPLHKTKSYAGILDGSRWMNQSSSSEAEIDIDLTPLTRNRPISQPLPATASESDSSQSERGNSRISEPKDILSIIKYLFNEITKWITDKFKSLLGNSPIKKIVQTLFSTFLNDQ